MSKQIKSSLQKQTAQKRQLEGLIKRHADGFGFFIPDNAEHPDVYIPKHDMLGVMTSDRVEVEAFPEDRDRFRGKVIRILKRGLSQGVGKFHKLQGFESGGQIFDEGHGWGEPMFIPEEDCEGAKTGELVVAQIVSYPGSDGGFIGKVVGRIGDLENPLNDIMRVLHMQMVPHEFPKKVVQEAEHLAQEVTAAEFVGRRDLTAMDFITIDGMTAKDFDDAICLKADPLGFRLWVAIADVSHYCKVGTALDDEAYIRGNSTYLPNFVVPMLPEALSNVICSLQPHVNRLSMVAELLFDYNGERLKSEFYEAVICSKSRVTYGEAQEVLDGEDVEKHRHVAHVIKKASQLAKILMKRRFEQGSLDLDIPETTLVIDEAGEPVDVIRSERLFSHRLIEEMMLAANVAVAEFFKAKKLPAIYRVHDGPKADDLERLAMFLKGLGGKVKLNNKDKLQKRLTDALKEFKNTPEALVLNILTLRSISQAQYSSNNIGHFGLGFEDYTHFTSPIRRYPDLIVHRLLKSVLVKGYPKVDEDYLAKAGTAMSATEQRSVKAERMVNSIKKARLMKRHLGEEFEGVVSSVTKFGIFVLLRTFDVDGLVRADSLFKEPFEFNESTLTLSGKRSGFTYKIGMPVSVTVMKADTESGNIDFLLAGDLVADAPVQTQKPIRTGAQKRGKVAKDSAGVRKARVSKRSGKNKSRKSRSR